MDFCILLLSPVEKKKHFELANVFKYGFAGVGSTPFRPALT